MLLIKKGREPDSLTRYRKTAYATYDGCNKTDIRKNLLAEQGSLCAYCMRRIHEDDMKIEHWYPEAELDEAGKLDYSNMLGVCSGHMDGFPGRYDTCDTHKGDTLLVVDPRKEEHIRKIAYRSKSGEIYSEDPVLNRDINETLNLNCAKQLLPQNRKAALDEVIRILHAKHKNSTWKAADVLPIKRIYESTVGERKEYAGIVLWYLNKIIHRATE